MSIFSGKENSAVLWRSPDPGSLCKQQKPDLLLMSQRSSLLQREKNISFGNLSFAFWFPLGEVGAESFRALLDPCLVLSRLRGPTSVHAWPSARRADGQRSRQLPICRALGKLSLLPAAGRPLLQPAGQLAPVFP